MIWGVSNQGEATCNLRDLPEVSAVREGSRERDLERVFMLNLFGPISSRPRRFVFICTLAATVGSHWRSTIVRADGCRQLLVKESDWSSDSYILSRTRMYLPAFMHGAEARSSQRELAAGLPSQHRQGAGLQNELLSSRPL